MTTPPFSSNCLYYRQVSLRHHIDPRFYRTGLQTWAFDGFRVPSDASLRSEESHPCFCFRLVSAVGDCESTDVEHIFRSIDVAKRQMWSWDGTLRALFTSLVRARRADEIFKSIEVEESPSNSWTGEVGMMVYKWSKVNWRGHPQTMLETYVYRGARRICTDSGPEWRESFVPYPFKFRNHAPLHFERHYASIDEARAELLSWDELTELTEQWLDEVTRQRIQRRHLDMSDVYTTIYRPPNDERLEWLSEQEFVTEFERVRFLDLSGSAVTDKGLRHIIAFPGLKYLFLRNTTVTDEGMKILGDTKGLTHLDVAHTPITDKALKHVGQLRELENLVLTDTLVSDAGLANLTGLPHLGLLNLGGTRVSNDGMHQLHPLDALRSIILERTEVSDEGVTVLSRFPMLFFVCLDETAVSDDGACAIAQTKTLFDVSLRSTMMGDAGAAQLAGMPRLKRIDLSRTNVGNRGLAVFENCKTLERIRIRWTNVTGLAAATFRKARPDCQVDWCE